MQHYMAMNRCELKLLDHPGLVQMHNTLDNRMKELSKEGVIRDWQQLQPISLQQEEHLWNTGLLGDDTPEKLVNTLLYLIGLHFALHACDEHKALKVGYYSQLRIKMDQESNRCYLEYTEKHSKNFQGSIQSLKSKPKVVRAFENLENSEYCIVHIFEKYLAKHPSQDPKCSKDLYLRPLAKPTCAGTWYSCQPLGLGTLSKVITRLCYAGGFEGRYSNHSLCSTAVTGMYDNQMDEQQITEVTGHKSVAVQNYKHTSMKKQQEVSDVLYGKKPKWPVTSTITCENPTFNLGMNSQAESIKNNTVKSEVSVIPIVNINVGQVNLKMPVINIDQPKITVCPVVNLKSSDLVQNSDGHIILPKIDIALTININWLQTSMEKSVNLNANFLNCT